MKKSIGLLSALALSSLFSQTVFAQDEKAALVPLPSLDDFTRGDDGWAVALAWVLNMNQRMKVLMNSASKSTLLVLCNGEQVTISFTSPVKP